MKALFLMSVCCIFLFSCRESDEILNEDVQTEDRDRSMYQFIKKLGYQDFEIQDIGDEYLVDGDILFF